MGERGGGWEAGVGLGKAPPESEPRSPVSPICRERAWGDSRAPPGLRALMKVFMARPPRGDMRPPSRDLSAHGSTRRVPARRGEN